ERAESVPDIAVLKEIAGLFDVSMDYLLEVDHTKGEASFQSVSKHKRRNRLIITLLSTSLVFLIATLIFVFWELSSLKLSQPSWIAYVYSLPIAFTVLLVFNTIWGKWKTNFAIISSLVWSILLAVYLSFPSQNKGLIFIIGIPTQIIILLWANYKLKGK
ncbi:MAG TPA: hypothetical protein DDW50_01525, partial [Firmicutes bacterium]|nr:hypothetical protein [Bacillota bacterium]